MPTANDWHEDREIAKDLIDHWLTQLEVKLPLDRLDLPRFAAIFGWSQHCHHVALQFIQITEKTVWWEVSASLIRLCHELAVKAQWIAQVDNAMDSEVWQHEVQRKKQYKTYKSAVASLGIQANSSITQEMIDEWAVDPPERIYGDFYQICQTFQDQDYLYLIYQILCHYSHANLAIPTDYVDVAEDGKELRAFTITPSETSDQVRQMLMHSLAQSLVWAQGAVISQLYEADAEADRLAEVAEKVGCPILIPFKPPKARQRRQKR